MIGGSACEIKGAKPGHNEPEGDRFIETILVLVKFGVRGDIRFLSHVEMVRLFQRACVRAGVKIRYSQGFNPRPRMSLPLPRPVGVESDGDLLCLRVESVGGDFDVESFKNQICSQLPAGCDLQSIDIASGGRAPVAVSARYVLNVKELGGQSEKLAADSRALLAKESITIERRKEATSKKDKLKRRSIDVRGFLKSIEIGEAAAGIGESDGQLAGSVQVAVEYKITQAGTVRVDEIMELLAVDVGMLTAPIRRTEVKWQNN